MSFPWIELHLSQQVDELSRESAIRPKLIFKHSSRCNLSNVSRRRLEQAGPLPGVDYYFLDVIAHSHIAQQVAQVFDTWHESPQVLLIADGTCVFEESHMGIFPREIEDQVLKIQKADTL